MENGGGILAIKKLRVLKIALKKSIFNYVIYFIIFNYFDLLLVYLRGTLRLSTEKQHTGAHTFLIGDT